LLKAELAITMVKGKSAQCSMQDHSTNLLMSGFRLKQVTVSKLEAKLKKDPSDLSSRLKLLGYYFRHCYFSKGYARNQLRSVLWMIQYVPEHKALREPRTAIHKELNSAGYDRCKRLWLKQLAKHKDDMAIITNL
jgi:hypothetical protein